MSIGAQTLHLITLINVLILGGGGVRNRTCKSSPTLYFKPVCPYVCCSLGIAKRIFTKRDTGELEIPDDNAGNFIACYCARNTRMLVGADNIPDKSCSETHVLRSVHLYVSLVVSQITRRI
jgi:hypothetical protein